MGFETDSDVETDGVICGVLLRRTLLLRSPWSRTGSKEETQEQTQKETQGQGRCASPGSERQAPAVGAT